MRLAFKIALRFLGSSKGQTLLIVLGIAIGVAVQVFIGSLIQGLQNSLIDKTIGRSSHITITSENEDRKIKRWEDVKKQILKKEPRLRALSEAADFPAFVRSGDKTLPVMLRGFVFKNAENIYRINESIVQGKIPEKPRQIMMGIDLKNDLGSELGDKVTLITPEGSKIKVTITGFYDFKVSSINQSWLISDLKTVQDIFAFKNAVTSIEMQINEVFDADNMAINIQNTLDPSDLKIDNWKAQNGQLLSGLQGQSISSYLIQVFVMVSVALGIASVLAITVLQKSKQLGILKAMGIRDSTASFIFLFQGFILGILGALLGILLGLGLTYLFTVFAVNEDGTPIITLIIDPQFIVLSGFIATLSATLAALLPARKSAKLSPIEVIKNG